MSVLPWIFVAWVGMLSAAPPEPALKPGEGLAQANPGEPVVLRGDTARVAPMGSLAKLVWLRLWGEAWRARGVTFHCSGTWRGHACWKRDGHGAVDLDKAITHSCNLAFVSWVEEELARCRTAHGEDVAKARVEAVFAPFLGLRIPPGQPWPPLGPTWVGDGNLLQTSPEVFVRWLAAPEQDSLRAFMSKRLTLEGGWWMKTGTAPVPGRRDLTSAWVAGSDGRRVAVLRLPVGRGKAEGITRFRTLLGIQAPEVRR